MQNMERVQEKSKKKSILPPPPSSSLEILHHAFLDAVLVILLEMPQFLQDRQSKRVKKICQTQRWALKQAAYH
jgi:hypothetical protein